MSTARLLKDKYVIYGQDADGLHRQFIPQYALFITECELGAVDIFLDQSYGDRTFTFEDCSQLLITGNGKVYETTMLD